MIYEQATIIVPSAFATALRNLSQTLGADTAGMFIVGLSPDGTAPATHFVSSGGMPVSFVRAMESPALFNSVAQTDYTQIGVADLFSLAQITTTLASCFVSYGTTTAIVNSVSTTVSETPQDFIARLGLKMIAATI